MTLKLTVLRITCALALAACGDTSPPPAQDTTPLAAAPATTEQPVAPAAEAPAPAAASPVTDGKPAAVVSNCSTTIESNDAMQFNVGSITVPSSCSEFTINMQHTGQMPVAAMGHSVMVSLASDLEAIARDGRLSGDEFAIYLPDADEVQARAMVESIRGRLRAGPMAPAGLVVTASFGKATTAAPPSSVSQMLHAADQAMYAEKRVRQQHA